MSWYPGHALFICRTLVRMFESGERIMNYGNIKECDIADGPGVRVSLFVSDRKSVV